MREYARQMVLGLQGQPGTPQFLDPAHVIATAKHFVGDCGTGGHDQGNNGASEIELRDIHFAGYPPAVAAGVQAVMASFSSWQGIKMHANHDLLTDVLKQRLHFDGGIREAVQAAGGIAELDPAGHFKTRPDVAIVVFGENPYAQFQGDVKSVEYSKHTAYVGLSASRPINLTRETNAQLSLGFDYRVDLAPASKVTPRMEFGSGCGSSVDLTNALAGAPEGQRAHVRVPLRCFANAGTRMDALTRAFEIGSTGQFGLSVANIRLESDTPVAMSCTP